MTKTGVSVDKDTSTNARIMVGTALSYLIVQGVAFAYLSDPEGAAAKKMEYYFSFAGFIVCVVLFFAYSIYQIMVPKLVEKRKEKAAEGRRERSMMLHAFYYLKRTGFMDKVASKPEHHHIRTEADARASALKLGRRWKKIATRRREAREAAKGRSEGAGVTEKTPLIQDGGDREIDMPRLSDSEESHVEEVEEEEPFWKTLSWSIGYMLFGAALVTVFSDPMVDVINDFASKEYGIGIPAFYVSFLITPYCSNASEVISSLIFAAKKRKANSSMTFSQLYGAATMNATFVLSIFFALITFRGLSWTFSAETVAILAVTLIVGAVASFKRHFATWWAFPILSLYPLSLVLVYVLGTPSACPRFCIWLTRFSQKPLLIGSKTILTISSAQSGLVNVALMSPISRTLFVVIFPVVPISLFLEFLVIGIIVTLLLLPLLSSGLTGQRRSLGGERKT